MKARTGDNGFVLVEAIAALAVTAFVAVALLTTARITSSRAAEARIRELAVRQAQLLMAEAVASLEPDALAAEGSTNSRLAWSRVIHDRSDAYPSISEISVVVQWTSGNRKGTFHLEAYRLAPK